MKRSMNDASFDGLNNDSLNIDDLKIRMIALDLDGTTLNSAGEITDRTITAFEECAANDVYIVISTGRPYTSLPDRVRALDGIDYAITSNGAHINEMSSGKAIYDDYLSEAAVREIVRLYDEIDCEIEIFIDGKAYASEAYLDHIRQHGCAYRNAEYVLWSRRPVSDITKFLLENRDRTENVNFCFKSVEDLEKYRAAVMAIPECTVTSSFKINLEIGGPNTSKKTALIELLSRLDIRREELMCCGDAPNDIEMLEFAGLGVAVGNAWGGTKDHADYITDSNDNDGVAKVIEKIVLKKS